MKPSFNFILLLSLTVISCSTNDQKQTNSDTAVSTSHTIRTIQPEDRITTDTTASTSDTMIIDRKAAVFYQPDSLQMEQRMKAVGEADFRAGADDYIYYVNVSAEYLEKQGLPVFDAKGRKYLKFVFADKQIQMVKLDTLKELWGMYLFEPGKKVYSADITMIEEEYKSYYK